MVRDEFEKFFLMLLHIIIVFATEFFEILLGPPVRITNHHVRSDGITVDDPAGFIVLQNNDGLIAIILEIQQVRWWDRDAGGFGNDIAVFLVLVTQEIKDA